MIFKRSIFAACILAGLSFGALAQGFGVSAPAPVPAAVVATPVPVEGKEIVTTNTTTDDAGATVTTTDTKIVIPWGRWINELLSQIETFIITVLLPAGLMWLGRKLPAQWAAVLQQQRVETLLANAVNFSFAAVEGATKGQQSTVAIANKQVAMAAAYAVKNAPALAKEIGDTLEPKIIARLSEQGAIPPEANGTLTGTRTVVPAAAAA